MRGPAADTLEAAFLQRSFGSIDEIVQTTRAWNLDLRQLEPGPTTGEILQAGAGGVLLGRIRCAPKLEQRGTSPAGMQTLAVAGRGARCRFHGQAVDEADVAILPPTREIDTVSMPDYQADTIAVPQEGMEAMAGDMGLPAPAELHRTVVRCNTGIVAAIRGRFDAIYRELRARPELLTSAALRREMQLEIPALLLEAIAGAVPRQPRPFSASRRLALARAREYIDSHMDEPPTVQSVCRAAGVSWRTLDYAFREQYALTPRAYLKAARLTAVRRALRQAEPDQTVADLANRWGFWHMGQFACDYRRQFGELPSRTLAVPLSQRRGQQGGWRRVWQPTGAGRGRQRALRPARKVVRRDAELQLAGAPVPGSGVANR